MTIKGIFCLRPPCTSDFLFSIWCGVYKFIFLHTYLLTLTFLTYINGVLYIVLLRTATFGSDNATLNINVYNNNNKVLLHNWTASVLDRNTWMMTFVSSTINVVFPCCYPQLVWLGFELEVILNTDNNNHEAPRHWWPIVSDQLPPP